MTYDQIISRFPDAKPSGEGYSAKCPAHEDLSASLSLSSGDDGRTLIKCHAGCETTEVVKALGLSMKDLFVDGKAAKPPRKCWKAAAERYAKNRTPCNTQKLADALGLPVDALALIPDLGFCVEMARTEGKPKGRCWTWPEFDAKKNPIGVAKRFDEGKERFKGSKSGLSLCPVWRELPGPIYVAEGMSDTVALNFAGIRAVGRPSNAGGGSLLVQLFDDPAFAEVEIIVLGENDRKKNGEWPGKTGAEKIAAELTKGLNRKITISYPPNGAKDVRAWFIDRCKPTDPREDWIAAGAELSNLLQAIGEALKNEQVPTQMRAEGGTDPFIAQGIENQKILDRLAEVRRLREWAARERGRARICVKGADEPVDEYLVNAQVGSLIANDDELYRFGGRLSRITEDAERDAACVKVLDKPYLRDWLSERVEFYKIVKTEEGPVEKPASIPAYTVDFLLSTATDVQARILSGLMNFPILTPTGRILSKEGYDKETKSYLDWREADLDLPENPTKEDAIAAAKRLFDLVDDFPFASESCRSSWLAGLLTPLARPAIAGCVPLFLIDASSRGTGKTKLAYLIGIITTGKDLPCVGFDPDPYQTRQMITGVLMQGNRLTLIDNIGNGVPFGNAEFDRLITSSEWKERILGGQQMFTGKNECVWFATGNQIALRGDLSRRICYIRLESPVEKPEEREDFRIPDLIGHTVKNRLSFLRDTLIILKAYEIVGRPKVKLKSWGSFEAWSDAIRQPIVWLGFADPYSASDTLRENTDTESEDRSRLLLALNGLGMGAPQGMSIADLHRNISNARSADPDNEPTESEVHSGTVWDYFVPLVRDGKPTPRTIAYQFRAMNRRTYGQFFLEQIPKTNRWRVQPVSEWDRRRGENIPLISGIPQQWGGGNARKRQGEPTRPRRRDEGDKGDNPPWGEFGFNLHS